MSIKAKIAQHEEADQRIKEAIAGMETRVMAMPLSTWLYAVKRYAEVHKEEAMREFVTGLHKRGLSYHFDDCAIDCLSETGISLKEAELINSLTKSLYCDEMFAIALKLLWDEQVKV